MSIRKTVVREWPAGSARHSGSATLADGCSRRVARLFCANSTKPGCCRRPAAAAAVGHGASGMRCRCQQMSRTGRLRGFAWWKRRNNAACGPRWLRASMRGEQLAMPVTSYAIGSAHGWLGAVGFAAPAQHLAARDAWWDRETRAQHLHRVIGMSRFPHALQEPRLEGARPLPAHGYAGLREAVRVPSAPGGDFRRPVPPRRRQLAGSQLATCRRERRARSAGATGSAVGRRESACTRWTGNGGGCSACRRRLACRSARRTVSTGRAGRRTSSGVRRWGTSG